MTRIAMYNRRRGPVAMLERLYVIEGREVWLPVRQATRRV